MRRAACMCMHDRRQGSPARILVLGSLPVGRSGATRQPQWNVAPAGIDRHAVRNGVSGQRSRLHRPGDRRRAAAAAGTKAVRVGMASVACTCGPGALTVAGAALGYLRKAWACMRLHMHISLESLSVASAAQCHREEGQTTFPCLQRYDDIESPSPRRVESFINVVSRSPEAHAPLCNRDCL